MRKKVVKVVDCSVLKLTGEFCGDEVRWQEGYVTLIQAIGPHCSVIMELLYRLPQSFPSFSLDSATTYSEIFSS